MREKIKKLLLSTKREGIVSLLTWMELNGFYEAPCSTQHHLCKEGGLAEHSWNVLDVMDKLAGTMLGEKEHDEIINSIIICSLLHDIGKSVDHDMEGSHIQIGVDLCKKYKESAVVINAVESHHGDVEPQTLEAALVQAADAISASRPGARRETLETYIKRLQNLEEIADSFEGVDKSFAIQAGREIRVIVKPDKISDDEMILMSRNIAKKIEDEMEYPGQIKVNMIREFRAVEYAK